MAGKVTALTKCKCSKCYNQTGMSIFLDNCVPRAFTSQNMGERNCGNNKVIGKFGSVRQDRQLRYKSCNGTAGYYYPSWNLYHLHYIFFPLGMYIKDELKVNHFQFYIVKTHLSPNRHHPMGIPQSFAGSPRV